MSDIPKVIQLTLTRAEAIAIANAIALAGATLDGHTDTIIDAVAFLKLTPSTAETLYAVASRFESMMTAAYPELVRL